MENSIWALMADKEGEEEGTTCREAGRWEGAWVPFAFEGQASLPEPFYANFGVKLADGFFVVFFFFGFFVVNQL